MQQISNVPEFIGGMLNQFDCERDQSIGHIYAVLYDDGIVKIGKTKNPKQRLYALARIRGYHHIDKAYFSEPVNHAYVAERRATKGLKPCYKKEFFDISWEEAVARVKAAAGDKYYFIADTFEELRQSYPNAEDTDEGIVRCVTEMLNLIKQNRG